MDWKEFVARVERQLGVVTPEPHVRAVIECLAEYIGAFDAKHMHGDLPFEVALRLADDRELHERFDLDEAIRDLEAKTGLAAGRSLELLEVVCRAIDESLDPEGRIHFRRNLPEDVVVTFDRSPQSRGGSPHGRSLADGNYGSTRPLSEANPAQADSIARDPDPHDDTRLSESRGTTQERKHRTLAEGEPGSTRPLSDHKPS